MTFARIRKALVAGGAAAVGALVLGLKTEVPQTQEGWVALVMGSLTIGVVAGLATYKARNTGPGIQENGSELDSTEYEAFKAAWTEAMKNPKPPTVLRDDDGSGPLSPGDRRG